MSGRVAAREAIRDTARHHAVKHSPVVRAEVTSLRPLTVQPFDFAHALTVTDDFNLSGWAKFYQAQVGFKVGDVALMHRDSEWTMFDVVSDHVP